MKLDRFEWLDQVKEAAVDPARAIVDPHHHLWSRGGSTYLAAELQADTRRTHNVTGTVFVECFSKYRTDGPESLRPVGETEFVAAQAQAVADLGGPPIEGIVGFADLTLGEAVEDVLVAHEEAAGGLFRGVRHAAAWDESGEVGNAHTKPDAELMAEPSFRTGLGILARRGHSYDAWLYHPQIPELTETARSLPQLPIVLNHLGAPLAIGPYANRGAEVRSTWRSSLAELADCANVYLKIGGVGMDIYFATGWADQERPPTSDDVAAHWTDDVRWCIDTFGPKRCMFESNFPVDRQTCTYAVLWNTFQKIAAGYDDTEQDALFSGTARRFYRLAID